MHLHSTQNLLLNTVRLQSNRKRVQHIFRFSNTWIFKLFSCAGWRLFGLCEAHSVVVSVEDGVVLADEYISQNPQGPSGGGDVQAHEATQTNCLSSLAHLDKVEGDAQSETWRLFGYVDIK